PPAVGALIGCAVTTGVGAAWHTGRVRPGQSVAVFGAGGVGLSAIAGAALAGAGPILALDRVTDHEAEARALGATAFFVNDGDALEAIRQHTQGRGADLVIDTTGVPAVQEQCLEAARPGGTVVLAGLAPMGSRTNLPGAVLVRQEKTVAGCYYGSAVPARDFPRLSALYLGGRLPLDRLVTRTYPLDALNDAYADLDAGRLARGVVVFPG
ncbi:MAG: zinc-binding dehydrogenase, partial [Rhodothermales bacterium]|nr:zinc-binding dehydrogenase [Rhodothermales bacterium]